MGTAASIYAPDAGFAANAPSNLSSRFTEKALAGGVVGYLGPEGSNSIHDQVQSDTEAHDVFDLNPWNPTLRQRIMEAAQNDNLERVIELFEKAYANLQVCDMDFAAGLEHLYDLAEQASSLLSPDLVDEFLSMVSVSFNGVEDNAIRGAIAPYLFGGDTYTKDTLDLAYSSRCKVEKLSVPSLSFAA